MKSFLAAALKKNSFQSLNNNSGHTIDVAAVTM